MDTPHLFPVSRRYVPAHRRRDKPQLSCDACRKRKSKCDRQLPCSLCLKRGLASTCKYPGSRAVKEPGDSRPAAQSARGGLQQGLDTLEDQIVTLMEESNTGPNATPWLAKTNREFNTTVGAPSIGADGRRKHSQSKDQTGNLSMSPTASVYVGGAHWAAILDSISELKEQVQFEKDFVTVEIHDDQDKCGEERPALLFENQGNGISKEALLAAMPARPTVDRLVSKYFNDIDMMLEVPCLHTLTFLRQYDDFWEDRGQVSIIWLGLLYSMMCLSAHFDSPSTSAELEAESPESSSSRPLYLDQVVQCLALGDYSRGGPHVIETLIHYHTIEHLRRADPQVDVWLSFGVMLRLALRMGYHRDPSHFPSITPFQGEMRRRVWTFLYVADVMLSMQVGVPRMFHDSQSDTRLPLNLFDHDFDEGCAELPQPRGDNETTPILYLLARYKMAKVMGAMIDMINDTQHDDSEIMKADKLLQDTYDSLPPILQLSPGSHTLADSPRTMLHRLVLATVFHSARIVLHRGCMSAPKKTDFICPNRSLDTLLDAALKVLEYQHTIVTETQPGGRLFSLRWKFSATLAHEFLLATTVLSKALFSTLGLHPLVQGGSITATRIRSELEQTHGIWLRSRHRSKEAKRAAGLLTTLFNALDSGSRSPETLDGDATMVDLEHYLDLNPSTLLPSYLF